MSDYIDHALFGWYPYVCLTVFVVSLLRFDREPYTWKAESHNCCGASKCAGARICSTSASSVIFAGHFVGLLTPIWIFDMIGVTHRDKQLLAIVVGGLAGLACLAGILLLAHRRLADPRIRSNSSFADTAILLLLLVQLLLGLSTIFVSLGHLDGDEMVRFMDGRRER